MWKFYLVTQITHCAHKFLDIACGWVRVLDFHDSNKIKHSKEK